jgi:hypothetical protein
VKGAGRGESRASMGGGIDGSLVTLSAVRKGCRCRANIDALDIAGLRTSKL